MANLTSISISIPNLSCIFLLFMIMAIIHQPSSARTLGNSHQFHHHKLTFLMRDLLNLTHPSSKPSTSEVTGHQLPFSKPIGLFPPNGGVHLPETNPSIPAPGLSYQTLDLSGIGLSFPVRATLQELEFGIVTVIEEEVYEPSGDGFQTLGRAQGMYVESSENGSSHMMALTVSFGDGDGDGEVNDGLRFFGVHRTDANESHIAAIGGSGKFIGANGYATLKTVSVKFSGDANGEEQTGRHSKLLKFKVYLS
ncbi:hypothetical protein FNV43_RR24887 [Rhamnella rubrinervis]|uniref:Dirigent protein n=1 Tax=Rhamnella rubrinervis TaxID=2594499 RepID=A0A8K0DT54_9ROSA|nr:hypothetical protein FNV43_RR24887 [Rhamnella rubrinervis]